MSDITGKTKYFVNDEEVSKDYFELIKFIKSKCQDKKIFKSR